MCHICERVHKDIRLRFFNSRTVDKKNALKSYIAILKKHSTCEIEINAEKLDQIIDTVINTFRLHSEMIDGLREKKKSIEKELSNLEKQRLEIEKEKKDHEWVLLLINDKLIKSENQNQIVDKRKRKRV